MSDRSCTPTPRSPGPLRLWLLVALLVGLTGLRSRPPAPAPADAPATAFSAERAVAVLERIVGDGSPHGVGTPANAAVADRIEAELFALGLTVTRQRTLSCRGIVCAPVVNLLAEVPGTHAGGPVVLLTSHYDSVHAGPGVADDLHGVALSVEVARALLAGDPPRHPVRLLIDEGEEVGLLGAEAYVRQHPDVAEVAVVVNAEARGTTGPSSLFQTSDGNGALMAAVLDEIPRPFATSLAVEVYRRMPNDTDLSVFLDAGHAGLNFAFVGGVGRYHTPLDDLDHLDHGSVQHQGDSVLASVRALAQGPLPVPTRDDAIYVDILGLWVVRWPASWGTAIAGILLLGTLGLLGLARRRGRIRLSSVALGPLVVLVLVVLAAGLGYGLTLLVAGVQGERVAAHAHPTPLRVALWLLTARITWALATPCARWARPLELAFGIVLTWTLLALTLALTIPGASVVLVVPVAVALVGLLIATGWVRHEPLGLVVGSIGFVVLWTQLSLGLEDAFGFALAPAVVIPIAVALSLVLPSLLDSPRPTHRRLRRILEATLVVTILVACVIPIYDADAPRRVALVHLDDRSAERAQVLAIAPDGLSPALADALGSDEPGATPTWLGRPAVVGPGVAGTDPPPMLQVRDTAPTPEGRRVLTHLTSPRGADRAVIQIPSELVDHVEVGGQPVATALDRRGRLMLFGVPSEGLEIALWLRGTDPIAITVVDCVAGLPESAAAIAKARDTDAIPVQWGDLACLSTRATL